jgi:hypothetical protein
MLGKGLGSGEALLGSSEGETDRGVDKLLGVLEPRVAAIDGDDGGSGDRVK